MLYLSQILIEEQEKIIYNFLVETRLMNGIVLWRSTLTTYRHKLQILQKLIFGKFYKLPFTYSSDDLFLKTKTQFRTQNNENVNLWCGIFERRILGLYLFDGNINAANYLFQLGIFLTDCSATPLRSPCSCVSG